MKSNSFPYPSSIKWVTFLLIISLFIPTQASAKRKPDWVKERPNDPAWYIGIAMSPKTGSEMEYMKSARAEALKQMSAEIKITISSNSILHQFENNFEFREEYETKVQTSVLETLEGYEVETYESKKEYWVMTRLSKERYQRMKQMKLDKAKTLAMAYYGDAKKALEQNDAFSALTYLSKGVISIKDHLDEDLTHKTVDGTFNVGADLFSAIQDVFQRIELSPVQSVYQLKFSKQLEVPIGIVANFYSNQGEAVPLSGFPLKFNFSKGEGILTSQSSTDRDGYVKVAITRLISKRKMQEIKASFDFSHIRQNEVDSEILKLLDVFFPEKVMPATHIGIEVEKSKAYLEMKETIFGDASPQAPFLNTIKKELNENFFTFTENADDADFIVKLRSDFVAGEEKKGKGYAIYLVFADFNMAIIQAASGEELFSDGLNGVRGMRPGNYEYALKDARANALQKFIDEIVLRLEQVDM
jgi:hypothetical protein